jgi:hypothetical protein
MSERKHCFMDFDTLCSNTCMAFNEENKTQPCTILYSLTRIARGTTTPAPPQPPKVMP